MTAIQRRQAVAVGVLAVLVLVIGSALAGHDEDRSAGPGARAERAARGLPLREQLGELMLTRFAGASVPAYVKRVVHDRRAAGVTLFTDNARSPAQLRALTREIQAAARGEALVAVDQEGGAASRLPWLHAPGQPTLATPTAAASASRSTARALRGVGVNLNLAPVADVSGGAGGAVAGRSFPGDSRSVAALTAAAVRAYRGTHVAPTPKHFPGFGRATANTDDAKVTIGASRADLAGDLAPFRAGIAAGAPAVMVSHALYPAYDRAWIASQSRAIVTGVLRGELHFRGVVATDSMEAEAVVGRSSLQDAAVYAIYAGCDLLVLTGRGSQRLVYERLLAEARRSPEFRRRVEESARRVLALKRALGLRTPPAR